MVFPQQFANFLCMVV